MDKNFRENCRSLQICGILFRQLWTVRRWELTLKITLGFFLPWAPLYLKQLSIPNQLHRKISSSSGSVSSALPFYRNQDPGQRPWCSAAVFELETQLTTQDALTFFSSYSIYPNSTFLPRWSKIVKILLYPNFSSHEQLKQILPLLIQTQVKSKSFLTC